LSEDPLANPFSDGLPRSPFRTSAMQSPPEELSEQPVMQPDEAGGDAMAQPNPFELPPQQPEAAPPQLAPDTAPGPLQNGNVPDAGFGPVPSPGRLPDPKADCEEMRQRLRANRLNVQTSRSIVRLDPTEPGETPYSCTVLVQTRGLNEGRDWQSTCYTWKASGLCHKPLYFEQAHMERYGHSFGPVLDSVISGAHFFATVPVLPYKMGLQPPCECVYPLGEYRPGNCAPRYIEPVPFSLRAAAAEAAVFTGLGAALP
jgi:hypothetical protein